MYFLREKRNNENELIANFEEINKKQIENTERKHMMWTISRLSKKIQNKNHLILVQVNC
ncbi:unnamed protein product [Paramecium octaurelia]|uniref:Uncharacterized protein n=1 Tax=Paramecium octaurelia TaxID=43137 RepID=A0A8S1XYH9_PAROT|nr:unnamed protein product [Paramecium octaurelia]